VERRKLNGSEPPPHTVTMEKLKGRRIQKRERRMMKIRKKRMERRSMMRRRIMTIRRRKLERKKKKVRYIINR